MEVPEKDLLILQRLEEELWISESRYDLPYMRKVMSEDFFEFGRSGKIYNRDQCLVHSTSVIDAVIPLKNLKIRLLAVDVAQVTYDSEVTYGGMVEKGRRSSIWTKSEKGWQLRFHQGTAFES